MRPANSRLVGRYERVVCGTIKTCRGLLPNLRQGALPRVGRENAGRRWLGVAILALLLAAGSTGATPTPDASTPEGTELPPPTTAVAATQQANPTATTSAPLAAAIVSPTAVSPTPRASPPAVGAAMVLPNIADIVERVRPAVVSIVA